jgi:tetratricopeptide (TPR) repeat protein
MVANYEAIRRFISVCNNVLIREKFNSRFYTERGFGYFLLEQYTRSIADFTKAVCCDPNQEIAYFGRGLAHAKLKSLEKAIQDYSTAIELDPNFKNAFYERGSRFADLKKFGNAINDFSRVLQLDSRNADAFVWRAFVYEKLEQYQAEIDDCTSAISIRPRFAMAYNNRGFAFWKLRQHTNAMDDLCRAIELDPLCTIAYANRGALSHELGKHGRTTQERALLLNAIDDFSLFLGCSNPADWSWAQSIRGSCYLELGRAHSAIEDTARALASNPSEGMIGWILYVRFRALKLAKQDDQILLECNELIERNQNLKHALVARAEVFERADKHIEALADFTRALDLFPSNVPAQFGKARANFKVNFESLLFGDADKTSEG